jgi:nucleotide-binding universal stress UspA family protein
MDAKQKTARKGYTVLVAVDFSPCSLLALRKAKSMWGEKSDKILALHVIDEDFVDRCARNYLGQEEDIKKKLFLSAKEKLEDILRKEGMDGEGVKKLICEGIPYIEINKQAVRNDVEMIVMGCTGNSGDMDSIFFGSTTEKVLRFIKRPVLCVPENEGNKMD